MTHVAGYTCLMDGSVRDYQKNSVAAGKNFDGSGAVGPWMVTAMRWAMRRISPLTTRGERRIAAAFQRGQADPQHPQDDRLPVRHHAPVTGRPAGDGLAAWGGTTPNTAALVERLAISSRSRGPASARCAIPWCAGRRARAMSDTANAKAPNMNGAESLVGTLVASGVNVCFANPGTSEMHFVSALDRVAGVRCVLCLFEGVATGAADGYGRMAGKPAATLLHLGTGFSNGIANLHNARRARTPILNICGEHALSHLGL